jgi:hypothetical protein
MPKHNFKKLNVAQKAQRKKERNEKRAQYKKKRQEREFSVQNLISRPSTEGQPLRILVLGDGDFSFSASLYRQLRDHQTKAAASEDSYQLRRKCILVATSYDSREEVVSKYPNSSTLHLRSLGAIGKKRKRRKRGGGALESTTVDSSSSSSLSSSPQAKNTSTKEQIKMSSGVVGAMCLHNVDATHLVDSLAAHSKFSTSSLPKVYDRIIWNFPHTGEQRVHLNRNIIRDFMDVAAKCLSTNGVIYVTLNWKPPYSLWDINTLYPTDQLEAIGYLKFNKSAWTGYEHQTTLGQPGGATPVQEGIDGARTYMFKLEKNNSSIETPEILAEELLKRRNAQKRAKTKEKSLQSKSSKRARMEGYLDSSTPSGIQEFIRRNGGDGSEIVSSTSSSNGVSSSCRIVEWNNDDATTSNGSDDWGGATEW